MISRICALCVVFLCVCACDMLNCVMCRMYATIRSPYHFVQYAILFIQCYCALFNVICQICMLFVLLCEWCALTCVRIMCAYALCRCALINV